MPPTGLEPARWVTAQALNLPRIPIPPQGLFELYQIIPIRKWLCQAELQIGSFILFCAPLR